MRIGSVNVRLFLAWYDMYFGMYWSKKKRTLYVVPIPMVVVAIEFGRSDKLWKTLNVVVDETTNTPEDIKNNVLKGRIELSEEEESHE